ncbi:carotenoid biosynthesis protein [Halobaculum sp. D14]|uniref:carotenoid biosynthesis protein n=1 Tax=Halobaculum sp. D14 TaxID=3421642 RepID=UPI003EC0A51D
MVRPLFALNLLMSLTALAAAFVDAYPSRDRLAFLALAVPYGVALEQLVILRFARYRYPVDDFLLTVADVPLVIGFGWAAILYAGYRTAERLDVSPARRPFFVGLFALHVDVAIDAVAIRAGFWSWTPPGVWFGVPLGNFLGWFLVAALFTAAWVGLRDRIRRPAVRASVSAVAALAGLIAGLQLWTWGATTTPRRVAVLGGLLALSGVVVATDDLSFRPIPRLVGSVPVLYHGFYLALLFGLGIFRTEPVLVAVSLAMLGVTAALHAGRLPSSLVTRTRSRSD